MKRNVLVLIFLSILLCSCSKDEDGISAPKFAMTAKIDSDHFEANSPFGDQKFSEYNIFSMFSDEDYILLQGREGGLIGTGREINIWLKKTDMVKGTYLLDEDSFDFPTSHAIKFIDNNNEFLESVVDGSVVINNVDVVNKVVEGTFECTIEGRDYAPDRTETYKITDGTFRYIYEE